MRRKLLAFLAVASLSGDLALAAPGAMPGQPVDQAELDKIQADIARFEEATRDYRGTVRHIVQREYNDKRKALMERYQSSIDREDKEEKLRRQAAIVLFENFLSKYANDDRWTPDAMFRLAELYFERSQEEYLAASTAAAQSGAQVTADYNKTVEIYRQLISRFPNYRLVDGAYYLMSYCLGEMGRDQEALQVMRALVCNNKYKFGDAAPVAQPTKGKLLGKLEDTYGECQPIKADSRFLPEAWTRVGETHFDNSELELAIAAYGRVLKFPESAYYDKALYKQAWSYYRADNYPEAVKRFDELVVFSDKKKAESGAEGSDLRTEAVQYLGVSFAEKDWNGDGVDDPEQGIDRAEKFYRGREKEPHVREIFAKLGDIYFDETEFFRAIQVYKKTIEKWPYDRNNPKLQDRVVLAFERMRDFKHAVEERGRLAKLFGSGSKWDGAMKAAGDREAINSAAELVELSLVSAALNHHKAAQDLKKQLAAMKKPDPKVLEQVSHEYAEAAIAYEKYLEAYPNSKNTYEYAYSYADTLYFSGRFLDAAKAYEKVRDSNLDNKYAEDSAFNAVKSYEKYMDLQTQAGKYSEPPKPVVGKIQAPIKPMDIPPVVESLQKAYQALIERVPNSPKVPTMAYKVAEIDYKYLHWDKARPELIAIVDKYCKLPNIGNNAGDAVIVTYTVENDLDKLSAFVEKFRTMKCSDKSGELGTLALGIKFKQADKLFADGKFEEAAALYVQIVDTDSKADDSDKALNNAAVAYEKVSRFSAATRLYERIVIDYPSSKFVDDALFRTAVSYMKGFEFDKAVVSYLRLVEDSRLANSSHRNDALYNAASILENDQNYEKAATLFKKYATQSGVKPDDQVEAAFRAANITAKLKDPEKTIAAYKAFVKGYGASTRGSTKVLEAYFHMAEAEELKKDHKAANDIYKKIVSQGANAKPASEEAEYVAHSAFILAEQKIVEFQKFKLPQDPKALGKGLDKLEANIKTMVEEYNKILKFQRATWTLAAYFRIGFTYEFYSKTLAGILQWPCPKEIQKKFKDEGCNIFRDELTKQIEARLTPVDEEVVKRYGVTLEQAGKLGVANEWTRLARQRASAYNPEKFPLVKDERIELQMDYP